MENNKDVNTLFIESERQSKSNGLYKKISIIRSFKKLPSQNQFSFLMKYPYNWLKIYWNRYNSGYKIEHVFLDSSRRPSNESTCSLNVPFEREGTPQVSSVTLNKKCRSQSLVNIARFQKSSMSYDPDLTLNGIEESPRSTNSEQGNRLVYRRGSLETSNKVNFQKL